MSSTTAPAGFETIAKGSHGTSHCPGQYFTEILVEVQNRGQTYRATIKKRWGSDQGCDEIHGIIFISARGKDAMEALNLALSRAKVTSIWEKDKDGLMVAFSQCEDELAEWLEEDK